MEKIKNNELRKPYYQLSDSIVSFKIEINHSEILKSDCVLKKLSEQMLGLQTEIQKHLDSKYIWD
jgi:hypothetical protein